MNKQEKTNIKIANNEKDYVLLESIAYAIWHEHYTPIIGVQQVDYMLQQFQTASKIESSIKDNLMVYYMPYYDDQLAGYCAIKEVDHSIFLSKFYIHKSFRGLGIASKMLEKIKQYTYLHNCHTIWLTVNKYNTSSIAIYKHFGFTISDELVTDIGNGYVMDDYKLTLSI